MDIKYDPRLIELILKTKWLNNTQEYTKNMKELVGDDRERARINDCYTIISNEVGTLIRSLKEDYSIDDIKREIEFFCN